MNNIEKSTPVFEIVQAIDQLITAVENAKRQSKVISEENHTEPTNQPVMQSAVKSLTSEDYLLAAYLVATCKPERLKMVISLLSKGGWDMSVECKAPSKVDTSDIASRIEQAQQETGYSVKELADIVGVSSEVLRSYQKGRRFPRPERYEMIVSMLKNLHT